MYFQEGKSLKFEQLNRNSMHNMSKSRAERNFFAIFQLLNRKNHLNQSKKLEIFDKNQKVHLRYKKCLNFAKCGKKSGDKKG